MKTELENDVNFYLQPAAGTTSLARLQLPLRMRSLIMIMNVNVDI